MAIERNYGPLIVVKHLAMVRNLNVHCSSLKKSDDFELEVHALHKNVACASSSLSTFYTKLRIEIFSVHWRNSLH